MDKKTNKDEVNEEASRAFMDALSASDDMHRRAMRRVDEANEPIESLKDKGEIK